MTAAPHSPLVDRVASALCGWRNGKPSTFPFEQLSTQEQNAYRYQARDALVACQAEEMRSILKRLTAPYTGDPYGESLDAIVNDADALLAKLDGKPAGGAE